METSYSYKNLEAYKEARNLVMMVYQLLKQFPKEETYALCDQLRRAVVSIPSNIAEGTSRYSTKEQLHFMEIAYGSLMEVFSQLDVACDLGYISKLEFEQMEKMVNEEAKLIVGMIKKRRDAAEAFRRLGR